MTSHFFRMLYFAGAIAVIYAQSPADHGNQPSASVTFRDASTDYITSDLNGTAYNASFVANGNVVVNTSGTTRQVCLNFANPNGSLNNQLGLNPPILTGCYSVYLSNNVDASDGSCGSGTGLLGMPIGSAQKSCFWINFSTADGSSWAIRFMDSVNSNTADALATRTSSATWTLETFSTDTCALVSIGKKSQTVEGYFFMPGQIAITEQ